MSGNVVIELLSTSKNGNRKEFDVIATPKSKSVKYELMRTRRPIERMLKRLLSELRSFKYREVIEVRMLKGIPKGTGEEEEEITAYFSSSAARVTSSLDITGFIESVDESILRKASE